MKSPIILALLTALATPGAVFAQPGPDGSHFMDHFDADKDGKVTQAEIDKVKSDLFSKFDSDGNGLLSQDEYMALRMDRMKERMNNRFTHQDKNGDGAISQEEFMTMSNRMMARLDENGDNVIDADELKHRMGQGHWGRHFGKDRCDQHE